MFLETRHLHKYETQNPLALCKTHTSNKKWAPLCNKLILTEKISLKIIDCYTDHNVPIR